MHTVSINIYASVAVYHLCVKHNRMSPSLIIASLGVDKHMERYVSLLSCGHRHQKETHTFLDEHMLILRFPTLPLTSFKNRAIIGMAARSAISIRMVLTPSVS